MIASETEARDWLRALPQWTERSQSRLDRLVSSLDQENQRQNLVAGSSMGDVWRRHIADSAQLLQHVERRPNSWLDLGTGAGFPGLVVAVLEPEMPVTLVESRKRRVEWLTSAIRELELTNVALLGCRIESVSKTTFAAISARAFAPLPQLLDVASRFSNRQTRWLLPKGRSAQSELADLSGWKHLFHVKQSLTDADAGIIVGELIAREGRAR